LLRGTKELEENLKRYMDNYFLSLCHADSSFGWLMKKEALEMGIPGYYCGLVSGPHYKGIRNRPRISDLWRFRWMRPMDQAVLRTLFLIRMISRNQLNDLPVEIMIYILDFFDTD